MTKKADEFGKTTANFRVDPRDWDTFSTIAHEQHGHGGISIVMSAMISEFNQKYDGKTPKLNKWLDPNFIPKPVALDNIDKIVRPFATTLKDSDLHELRSWFYQAYIVCEALSKMTPQKRLNNHMTYDELFVLVNKSS